MTRQSYKWEDTPFKGDLARARGLGSAHEGVHHWVAQRVTAVANIPLALWGVWSVMTLAAAGASFETVRGFFAQPVNAVLMILFIISVFYHMALGIQVVIEDYSHSAKKPFLLMAVRLGSFALAVACVVSVLKLTV